MYICITCGHLLNFHKPKGGKDPCYLCPPDECMVAKCSCRAYDGTKLTDRPHKDHLSMRMKWGSWGVVNFSSEDDITFVGGPEPIIERAGVRIHPGG